MSTKKKINTYQDLLNISENSATLNELLEGFYKYINNPIAISNESYEIIAYKSNENNLDTLWTGSLSRGYWTVEGIKDTLGHFASWKDDEPCIIDSLKDSPNRRLFLKLSYKNKFEGYLEVLEYDKKNSLESIDKEILTIFSNELAKILYLKDPNSKKDDASKLLEGLLDGTFKDDSIIDARANAIHFDLKKNYYLIVFSLKKYLKREANFFETNLNKILSHYIVCSKEEYIMILLDQEITSEEKTKLDNFLFFSHLYAISSSKIINIHELNKKFLSLKKLLNILIKNKNEFVLYDEESYKIFLSLIDIDNPSYLLNYINKEAIEVAYCDYINHTDYLRTLYTYILTERSLNETSKRLFTHKNTISYRLDKIKELFDMNFDDYNLNFSILYSVTILSYLQFISFDFSSILKK